MSNGRGMWVTGILGLAIGLFVGNSVKRGSISRQVSSKGRVLIKRARGKVSNLLD